jgi:hypothetical protein
MSITRLLRLLACLLGLLYGEVPARAAESTEYQLKAAFLFNFVAFTEWPASVGGTLQVCVYGQDPFGAELDKLQGRRVGSRGLAVHRTGSVDALASCQVVFISRSAIGNQQRVFDVLNGKPVLTVADSPGAARQGVVLNMVTEQDKVSFTANPGVARSRGLGLSAKLLRLAR